MVVLTSVDCAVLSCTISFRFDVKRSPCNGKSYLLHLPRTKTYRHGQVLVKQQSPVKSIAIFKNHLYVSYAPPIYASFHIPHYGWSSHTSQKIFLTKMQLNIATAWRIKLISNPPLFDNSVLLELWFGTGLRIPI